MSSYAFWTAIWQGLLSGVLCLGVYISFRIVRFPDLTCDGTYPLGACVVSALITSGVNPFIATLIAVLCGAIAGATTGLLNTKLRIPAIVSSILVMTALYSVNLVTMKRPVISLSKRGTVFTAVENFLSSHSSMLERFHLSHMVYPALFFIAVLLIKKLLDIFLSLELGLALRDTGDNPKMARAMSINVDRMIWTGLAMANGLIALSGSLFAQMQRFADVNLGIGMIIVGLASVFIGEAIESKFVKVRSSGSSGATTCVIIGSIIYKLTIALAYETGLSTDYFNLLTSIIVVIVLLVPAVRKDILTVIKREI